MTKTHNFSGTFYLRINTDYTADPKKFTVDMLGKHGGDFFDFTIDTFKVTPHEGEDFTDFEFTGYLSTDLGDEYTLSDKREMLIDYIAGPVESYTRKYPQMLSVDLKRANKRKLVASK